MTKDETKKAIEIMQAYVDGKNIQVLSDGEWLTFGGMGAPEWNFSERHYRVKPEPLECWVTVMDGNHCSTVYNKEYSAEHILPNAEHWTVRKFREVIE